MKVVAACRALAARREIGGRIVLTASGKQPTGEPAAVQARGLEGDDQADAGVHGGLARAPVAPPAEPGPFWRTVPAQARAARRSQALASGTVGEKLTLQGLTEDSLRTG